MLNEVREYCQENEIELSNIAVRNDDARAYPMMGYVRSNVDDHFSSHEPGAMSGTLTRAFKGRKLMVGDENHTLDQIEILPQFYVGESSVSFLNNEHEGYAVLVEFKYGANKAFTEMLAQYYDHLLSEAANLYDLNKDADKKDKYLIGYVDTWMLIYESKRDLIRLTTVDLSNKDWAIWFSRPNFSRLCKSIDAAVNYGMEMFAPFAMEYDH